MVFEQLYPEFAGRGQLALGRDGDHFLEVLRGGVSTFVQSQQCTRKVHMIAGIVLSTFLE